MDPTPVIQDLLFNRGVLGVCLALMFLYFCLQGWHFRKLLSGEPDKHKPVFDEVRLLIKSEQWGTRYRVFLKKLLAQLTGLIGDYHRFPNELPQKLKFRADDPEVEQLHKQDTLRRIFGVNPFTVESYQFCFLLALIYPILSFMVGWIIGGNGLLGDLEILPGNQPFYIRLGVTLLLLFSAALSLWGMKQTGWKLYLAVAVAVIVAISSIALAIEFTGAVAVVLALALVFVLGGAITVIFSVSMAFALVLGDTFALPWYFALLLVWGLTGGTIWLYLKAQKTHMLDIYWYTYSLMLLTASLALLNWLEIINAILTLLFFLILPLVNAPLDWLSLGITRALLQSIRFNQHRVYKALIWSLLDLLMAAVALLLVSGVTVGVVSLANLMAVKPIIDLESLFKSLSDLENWKDNLWIYFMLLSTLIPTMVHFSLAGGALTLAVSKKKRMDTLKDIETNNLSANKAWLYVSVMPAFGFVLAPTLLLSGLYWLLQAHGALLGNGLLAWAEMLSTWIDPSLGQLPKT